MREEINRYHLGDMEVCYLTDESGRVELVLVPAEMEGKAAPEKAGKADSMIQFMLEGDAAPGGFAAGHTSRNSASLNGLTYKKQSCLRRGDQKIIETLFDHESGLRITHRLVYKTGWHAVKCHTEVVNAGNGDVVLTFLSSFSLGMITPFDRSQATNKLRYYRIRSKWSAEGSVESGDVEDLQLEPSWSGHGVAVEKYGETGSLPVRKFFPFGAVEDTENHVVWAASLGCSSSWQMEFYRRDESLCLSGGIADFDSGHWKKRVKPGETFITPEAYLTVSTEGFDAACQNLTALQDGTKLFDGKLPVIFNEFCTSWGKPDRESIEREAAMLKGKDVDYFVIDAGWYADRKNGWENNMGDWEVSKELFPDGIEEAVRIIEEAGMNPGIWFEAETVGKLAKALQYKGHLLKRDGKLICSGERYFWDMREEWTKRYLRERIIDFLAKKRFNYIKIDYNESIGVGCDGAESLGQGLYENIQASKQFFEKIHQSIPDICLEICASGGHRLEPSFLNLADLASFSDAHEEPEIPVIAANLHRVMRPEKCQIWSVIRQTDSARRICYSMAAAFLGVLCISGDILHLDSRQWEMVEKGIAFYRRLSMLQKDGKTFFYGTKQKSYRQLEGWQGIWRKGNRSEESYLILHSFAENQEIRIDMEGEYTVEAVYEACPHAFCLKEGKFTVRMQDACDAMAVLLKKKA